MTYLDVQVLDSKNHPASISTKPTVLCVDDERIVLDSLKVQLKKYLGTDCYVEIAESGIEALEIIEELYEDNGSPPSVIVCDQIMPHMKGDVLLAKVKKMFPKTLCILLTGQADFKDVIAAINNAGLYRYLSKPWDKEDLNLTVKQALIAHSQDTRLEIQNQQLIELNRNLEIKVEERTKALTAQKEELEEKNNAIIYSLNYAKRIQDTLLPTIPDQVFGRDLDYFILYKPQQVVSGDFYWGRVVGDIAIMAVIDCTGHGVPGALMSMISYELLFNAVLNKGIMEPGAILNDVHQCLVTTLKQNSSGVEDGMDMTICCANLKTSELKFAAAKNPLLYVKDGELMVVKANSLPIGGLVDLEREYEQHSLIYDETMSFYMASDGYQDQFGGEKDKKFSRKAFRNLLAEVAHLPMKEQGKILEQRLNDWQGDQPQVDDITVAGFRFPVL